MHAGARQNLILTYSTEAPAVLPFSKNAADDLERTLAWWEKWSAKFTYRGPYRPLCNAVRLLQFAPTGAFVAAATTSLSEKIGGKLNWDYRYCWLCDASFNVQALCGTGYGDEAKLFTEWMLHATRLTQPKLMVMYDLFGNGCPNEKEIEYFRPSWIASRPYRNLAKQAGTTRYPWRDYLWSCPDHQG